MLRGSSSSSERPPPWARVVTHALIFYVRVSNIGWRRRTGVCPVERSSRCEPKHDVPSSPPLPRVRAGHARYGCCALASALAAWPPAAVAAFGEGAAGGGAECGAECGAHCERSGGAAAAAATAAVPPPRVDARVLSLIAPHLEEIDAAVDALLRLGAPGSRLFVTGHSLGGARARDRPIASGVHTAVTSERFRWCPTEGRHHVI